MRLAALVVVSLLLVAAVAAQGEGAARAVKDDEISLGSIFTSIYGFFQNGFSSMFGTAKESKGAKPTKKVNYRRWRLFKATPQSQDQLDEMQSIEEDFDRVKYWILPMERNQTVDFVVPPDMVGVMKDFLRERQINFQVMSKDLQKTIDAANPPMSQERSDALKDQVGHSMTWRRYHRYTDILRYMQYLEKTYPDIVSVVKLGKSTGGMPLKALKISTPAAKNAEPKPAIWIDGGTHAREWISPAVTTYIMKQLVENSKVNRMIVNTFDWYIQPVLNPDGYEYSHTTDRLWRKTRSQTKTLKDDYDDDDEEEDDRRRRRRALWPDFLFNSLCTKVGVDPNRNWDFHWGKEGASPSPCAETYAGPSAFSEPETKAVADFIMERKDQIKIFLTLHSYGQMWLLPWSFTDAKADDHDDMMRLGRKAVDAVAKIRGTKYKLGPTTEYLYKSAGSADDWAKGVAGIKYSYTVELPDKGYNGFLLPASEIIPVGKETFAGIKALAREYVEVHLPKPTPVPAVKRQPLPAAVTKRPQIKNGNVKNNVTTPPSVQKRTTVVQLRKSTPIPIRITTAKAIKNIAQNRRAAGNVRVKNSP